MRLWMSAIIGMVLLGGCSEYGYRYAPRAQPVGNFVFADFRNGKDSTDFLIDTNGLRVEQVNITKADGTVVLPKDVNYPAFQSQLVRGVREELYGPELGQGPTVAHFDPAAIGPAPWNVSIEVQGESPVTIRVGGRPTAINSPLTLQASVQ